MKAVPASGRSQGFGNDAAIARGRPEIALNWRIVEMQGATRAC